MIRSVGHVAAVSQAANNSRRGEVSPDQAVRLLRERLKLLRSEATAREGRRPNKTRQNRMHKKILHDRRNSNAKGM